MDILIDRWIISEPLEVPRREYILLLCRTLKMTIGDVTGGGPEERKREFPYVGKSNEGNYVTLLNTTYAIDLAPILSKISYEEAVNLLTEAIKNMK